MSPVLKFAAFEVTSAVLVPENAGPARLSRIRREAHRHHFDYQPRPGYLYVRCRAISSRTNDNYDEFPAAEIKKAYKTFIGKPVFVNHVNDNHRLARGVIIDAVLHEDRLADGSPDTWAELLQEIDAIKFPKLTKAILSKRIDRTSMGCDVDKSVCSMCGNEATTPAEYCHHIPRLKGKKVLKRNASTGAQEEHLIRETCYGLRFFENSLLVEPPADPTAFFTGVDDHSGLAMAASRKTAVYEHKPGANPIYLPPEVTPERRDEWLAGGHPGFDEHGHSKYNDGRWRYSPSECVKGGHHMDLEGGPGYCNGPGTCAHCGDPAEPKILEPYQQLLMHKMMEGNEGAYDNAEWALNRQETGPTKYSSLDDTDPLDTSQCVSRKDNPTYCLWHKSEHLEPNGEPRGDIDGHGKPVQFGEVPRCDLCDGLHDTLHHYDSEIINGHHEDESALDGIPMEGSLIQSFASADEEDYCRICSRHGRDSDHTPEQHHDVMVSHGWSPEKKPGYDQAEADCPHQTWDDEGRCQGCGYSGFDWENLSEGEKYDSVAHELEQDFPQHEDADWLLSQQHTGPTKYSFIQAFGGPDDQPNPNADKDPSLDHRLLDHLHVQHGISPPEAMSMAHSLGIVPEAGEEEKRATGRVADLWALTRGLHAIHNLHHVMHNEDFSNPAGTDQHTHDMEDPLRAHKWGKAYPDLYSDRTNIVDGRASHRVKDFTFGLHPDRTDAEPNMKAHQDINDPEDRTNLSACPKVYPDKWDQDHTSDDAPKCEHCGAYQWLHAAHLPSEVGQVKPEILHERGEEFFDRQFGDFKPVRQSINSLTQAYGALERDDPDAVHLESHPGHPDTPTLCNRRGPQYKTHPDPSQATCEECLAEHEGSQECDDPYCQETNFEDGWHTKAEHMDPAHKDPNSDESRDAQKSIEDALGDHSLGFLLEQNEREDGSNGPSRYSSLTAAFGTQWTPTHPSCVEHRLEPGYCYTHGSYHRTPATCVRCGSDVHETDEHDYDDLADAVDDAAPGAEWLEMNKIGPTKYSSLVAMFAAADDESATSLTRRYASGFGTDEADQHTTCDQGHTHWGAAGAAGLLIRHTDDRGTHRYLLQHRAPWVDQGDTWGIPAGALHFDEDPKVGAVRESLEELGGLPHDMQHLDTHTDDHGGWAFHTVMMQSPSRWGVSGGADAAHEVGEGGTGWFTAEQMAGMKLHPGFKKTWDSVLKAKMEPQRRQAGREGYLSCVHCGEPVAHRDHKFGQDWTHVDPDQPDYERQQCETVFEHAEPNLDASIGPDYSHPDPFRPWGRRKQAGYYDDHPDDRIKTNEVCEECGKPKDHIHMPRETQDHLRAIVDAAQMRDEMYDHAKKRVVNLNDPADLRSHLMTAHGYDESDFWRNSHDEDHPALRPFNWAADEDDRPLTHGEVRDLHDWEHGNGIKNDHEGYDGGMPGHFMGHSHFHTASRGTDRYDEEHPIAGVCPHCGGITQGEGKSLHCLDCYWQPDEDEESNHTALRKTADEDQCPHCGDDGLMRGGVYHCQGCGKQFPDPSRHPQSPRNSSEYTSLGPSSFASDGGDSGGVSSSTATRRTAAKLPGGFLEEESDPQDYWAKPTRKAPYDPFKAHHGLAEHEEGHGPWNVVRHPETRAYHVIDNQGRSAHVVGPSSGLSSYEMIDHNAWRSAMHVAVQANQDHGHIPKWRLPDGNESPDTGIPRWGGQGERLPGCERARRKGESVEDAFGIDAQHVAFHFPKPEGVETSTEDPKVAEYKKRAADNPAPEVYPTKVVQQSSSREHGTTYRQVHHGDPEYDTKGAFHTSSPEDEWHGPYRVIQHPETHKYHVADNQDRITGYGGRDGVDEQHHAEYLRDYADGRQASKERAKGIAESLWEGVHQAIDPGSTPESRRTDRYADSLDQLATRYHGGDRHPQHPGRFDWDDEDEDGDKEGRPYYEVKHPSGFTLRDYGGDNAHVYHQATPDEAHDLIRVTDSTGWDSPEKPEDYGHDALTKELHTWVHGKPHDPRYPDDTDPDTGRGYSPAKYIAENDPRINRWQRRNGYRG